MYYLLLLGLVDLCKCSKEGQCLILIPDFFVNVYPLFRSDDGWTYEIKGSWPGYARRD